MQAHIKLGRFFGVPVGLHYSWLIIALLVTLSLTSQFYAANPQWGAGVIWATALVTGLLFFAGIVAHELSHAMVAKARGIPVRSITLFALGGVALDWAAEELRVIGLNVVAEIIRGDPQRTLVDEARRWQADCIFVGSRGLGGALERLRLGSVSTALVTNAHCSVEVVRMSETT
jgi:nucleotide-binding universal stress UspA family protein